MARSTQGIVLSEREVADMAVAYGWISWVPDVNWRRVLWLRSLVHPRTGEPFWGARRMGHVFSVHPSTIDLWHAKGLRSIAATLHRLAVPAHAQNEDAVVA
jgi:hypothetical protein